LLYCSTFSITGGLHPVKNPTASFDLRQLIPMPKKITVTIPKE
jgi:hypothetical protein